MDARCVFRLLAGNRQIKRTTNSFKPKIIVSSSHEGGVTFRIKSAVVERARRGVSECKDLNVFACSCLCVCRMFSHIYIHQYIACVLVMKLSDDDHSKRCPSACANVLFLYFNVTA